MSSFDKSADLERQVRAISMAVLIDSHLRESDGFEPSCLRNRRTTPTSQKCEYLGVGGSDYMSLLAVDTLEGVVLRIFCPSTFWN